MKKIKLNSICDVPKDYTGIADICGGKGERKRVWYKDGKFHREGGSAIAYDDGAKLWYQNGLLHRADGPAMSWVDGGKSWWLNDIRFETKEEWFQALTSEQKENALWNLELWK